jgi:TRAP-type C4-dicarboxylate transport system permease small subunit
MPKLRPLTTVEFLARLAMAAGAGIILVQTAWITYGVFARYVLRDPDRYVTEATALLMVPLAFLGMPFALSNDGFPRITILLDNLPKKWRRLLDGINQLVMMLIGCFVAAVGINATRNALETGSASQVLHWKEYLLWFPVALSLVIFVIYAFFLVFYRDRSE